MANRSTLSRKTSLPPKLDINLSHYCFILLSSPSLAQLPLLASNGASLNGLPNSINSPLPLFPVAFLLILNIVNLAFPTAITLLGPHPSTPHTLLNLSSLCSLTLDPCCSLLIATVPSWYTTYSNVPSCYPDRKVAHSGACATLACPSHRGGKCA